MFSQVQSGWQVQNISSPSDPGSGHDHKKSKKKKHKKRKKKSKKKAKKTKASSDNTPCIISKNDDTSESDTEEKIQQLIKLKLEAESSKRSVSHRHLYRPHLRIPGESFLRGEVDDPITLVEVDSLPVPKSTLLDRTKGLLQDEFHILGSEQHGNNETASSPQKFQELQEILQTEQHITKVKTHSESPFGGATSSSQTVPLSMTRNSCRFQIPMDTRTLQTMAPWEYLKHNCVPQDCLKHILTRVFQKHKNRSDNIPFEKLALAIADALGQQLTSGQQQQLEQLSCVGPQVPLDMKLFSGLCCLAIRILCHDVEQWTNDSSEKHLLEQMDFNSLLLHWNKVSVHEDTVRLLEYIHSA